MGEIINFQERRKNFMQGIQLANTNRVSYIGDRITRGTPEQERNHRRLRRAAEMYYSLPEEERIKIQRQKMIEERRNKKITGARSTGKYKGNKKSMSKALIAVGISAILAMGAYIGIKSQENVNNLNNKVTLEQVIENQSILNELGINKETAQELEMLQQELESGNLASYSNEDLLSFGRRVEDVQMDIIKSKLAETLEVGIDDIEIKPNYSTGSNEPDTATVKVNKEGEEIYYNQEDLFNLNNNISQEIANGIISVGNTQTVNSKVEKGEFDREGSIEQSTTGIENAAKIALKEMIQQETGTISLQEIDNLIQNNEIEQDEER